MKRALIALSLALSASVFAQHSVRLDDPTMGIVACPLAMKADGGIGCRFDKNKNFVSLFDMSTEISGSARMEAAEKTARTEFARMANEHMANTDKAILIQYSDTFITNVKSIGKNKFKFTAERRIMGFIPVSDLMSGMGRRAIEIEAIPLEGFVYVTHVPKDRR